MLMPTLRMEIKTLIEYGRLAWYETRLKEEQRPLSAAQVETLLTAWRNVCNRPKRYITSEVRQHVVAHRGAALPPPFPFPHPTHTSDNSSGKLTVLLSVK